MPRKRILVVEDENIVAEDIQRRLALLGYSAVTAATADEALARAAADKPDLVLMDIRLRGKMDGIEAARRMRDAFNLPVVYLTAYADGRTVARAKLTTPFGYLLKPFSDSELQTCIQLALQWHLVETELRESESWCRSILRCIGDAVIVTDRKGLVMFVNPVAEKLTGWKASEAAGRKLSVVFKILSEDKRKPVATPVARLIRGEAPTAVAGHVVLVSRDGTESHIDDSAAALSDDKGNVMGLVLVFRDVTERHVMAKNMLSRQKVEAIGNLCRGIAHDFGQYVRSISAYASSLSESLIPKTRAHADALEILETARRANDLNQRLLNIARVSEPATEQAVAAVSLAQAITDTARLLEKTLGERGITLRSGILDNMPFVTANPGQLLDSLMCVFLNAADAMPSGGAISVNVIRRNISSPNRRLNPHARKGPFAVIRVADTGHGMTRETIEHIFEPFFTTRNHGLAKGLGLTMVHSAVTSWGGWITVRSAPGKGSTFSLYIPASDAPRAAQKELRPEGRRAALVIDDSAEDLAVARDILEADGFKVRTADGAEEGLALLRRLRDELDLVVIDLIMPGKDGRNVFDAVFREKCKAGVVIMSGFSRDYARNCLGTGGWGFAQKPVEKEHLMAAVSRALAQREVSVASEEAQPEE